LLKFWKKGNILLSKPNILLLTIDTLRPDRLGCYGFAPSITPNIDRLAENGIQFTQAITGGSWTQAAFPVMLTSTYASMYGGCLGPLAADRPSPINALKEGGYTTAGFSTSPLLSRSYGYERSFDDYIDLDPGEKDPWLRTVKGGHNLLKQPITHYLAGLMGIRTRPAKIYASAAELTDQICDWIGNSNDPFFIWGHYMDVHWPYHLENSLTDPSKIAQAWKDVVHLYNANWKDERITSAQRDHYIDLYEKAVSYTDFHLGRLFDFLNMSGLDQNTIIVLVSDHGEEFLEHGRWGHWEDNLYDEILKVPLLIHLPGMPEGIVISEQVRTLDLMPTILELTECSSPEGLKGMSLLPLWSGNADKFQPSVAISEMWRDSWHIIAIRNEKYKYIWDNKRTDEPWLFDLEVDGGEERNLSPDLPGVVDEFRHYVDEVLEEMERTKSDLHTAPELDDEMLNRLRDLGYVQ
jgi:arylsulfatase A-like enzyme